jgi:hypothetical protein
MPWVGSEPKIPAFERAKTVHALHGAATVFCLHSKTHFTYSRWIIINTQRTDTIHWHKDYSLLSRLLHN